MNDFMLKTLQLGIDSGEILDYSDYSVQTCSIVIYNASILKELSSSQKKLLGLWFEAIILEKDYDYYIEENLTQNLDNFFKEIDGSVGTLGSVDVFSTAIDFASTLKYFTEFEKYFVQDINLKKDNVVDLLKSGAFTKRFT